MGAVRGGGRGTLVQKYGRIDQFHVFRYCFLNEYVQGTKTVYYLLYKIEGILSTVHKIMYFMNNMLTSRDNVLPGC